MTTTAVQERYIDLDLFARATLETDPFPYILVPGFVPEAVRAKLAADYPKIDRPGSFPTADLRFGAAFAEFLREIEGPAMRAAFAQKFAIDLSGRPTMVTVRGQAQLKDGSIHTDTASKLITVLIYMNEAWEAKGGRLRLLRSDRDLEDMVTEVPPAAGTLLAFRVTKIPGTAMRRQAGRAVSCNSTGSKARRWCAASVCATVSRRG